MSTTPQKQKRVTSILIGLACSTAAFFAGLGVGLSSNDEPAAATAEAVATNEAEPMHTPEEDSPYDNTPDEPEAMPSSIAEPEPISEPEETGPETFAVGDTGTVTEDGVETGTITVEKVETTTEPESAYSDPPANGQFLIIHVKATALEGQLFDVGSFDWYVRDAEGNRWDTSSGSSYFLDSDLHATTLNGGETVRGTVVIDASTEAVEIVYAPGMRALGVWTIS